MSIKARCRITGSNFEISDIEFAILKRIGEANPVLRDEPLPLPTVHPLEALRRIFVFGSLRWLFKGTSAISGKPILTRYNPILGYKVCTQDEFYDVVDNTEVGREYDFSRPFFEQWNDLLRSVTLPPLNKTNCEDSDYVNGAQNLKSCYLCFAAYDCRDCLNSLIISNCTDCVDLFRSIRCELCYSSIGLQRCYSVQNSKDCRDCVECFGCYDCHSCKNCYGSVGLIHKQYHIFNNPVTKNEYDTFIRSKSLHAYTERAQAASECRDYWARLDHRSNTILNCSNSTGAYLERCEECSNCWSVEESKLCSYLVGGISSHSCARGLARRSEFTFESVGFDSQACAYNYSLYGGNNDLYCAFLYGGCSDCFGSIALNHKSYCVLNKQYSRAEYLELVPQIIAHMKKTGEWGEWFPVQFAPHYYQESSIHESLVDIPIELAKERGYRIGEPSEGTSSPNALRGNTVPEVIDDNSYGLLLGSPIQCERTDRLFNLQRSELNFYRRNGIPPPRIHWRERMQLQLNHSELAPAI